jgi:hypothetical protein
MSTESIEAIAANLPRLRRYGALLLGSKALADQRIEAALACAPAGRWGRFSGDPCTLYQAFHDQLATLPELKLQRDDFMRRDHRMVVTLHKLSLFDRALLLLTSIEDFTLPELGVILSVPDRDLDLRLARARSLLEAGYHNRLCFIVEDDLIAMRDLQAEVTMSRLGVAALAKNRTEAFNLADQVKPDIGIIDLALPEGATAGAEVAKRLRERFATKIIFVTAFGKIAHELADPRDAIVTKPWSPASLKQAIAMATI